MKDTAQPPVIRVRGNIYVLAETSLDQYKAKLNAVAGDIHAIASEVMTILDKAKMGPANELLKRRQDNVPGEGLDKEDGQVLTTFMKFWEDASGILGTFVGEFSEVPFEEGHGRDLVDEEQEYYDYSDPTPVPVRQSSSIGSQLAAAYGKALAKLDEFMDVFGRILPLLHGWDRLAKEVSSKDPSKAEELSSILEELMNLKDLGSKVADLAMSADYVALQPQVHARTANGKPKRALVRFPRFITVSGSLYKVNIEKTNDYRMRSGEKTAPLPDWSAARRSTVKKRPYKAELSEGNDAVQVMKFMKIHVGHLKADLRGIEKSITKNDLASVYGAVQRIEGRVGTMLKEIKQFANS